MNHITQLFKYRQKNVYLYPILFFCGTFIHLLLEFYLRLNENVTGVISTIVYGAIAVFMGINYLIVFNGCNNKKIFACSLIIPFLGMMQIVIGFMLKSNAHILNILFKYLVFSMPMFILAMVLIEQKCVEKFIKAFKWYGVLVLPFCLFYIYRICSAKEINIDLISYNNVNYMSIAYMFMPIIMAMILELYFYETKKKIRVFNMILISIFWLTIIFSGTRGAVMCTLFGVFALLLFDLIWNGHKNILFMTITIFMLLLLYSFLVYIWSPPSSGANFRLNEFDREITAAEHESNRDITIKWSEDSKEVMSIPDCYLRYIVESKQVASASVNDIQDGNADFLKYLSENDKLDVQNYEFTFGSRVTLFKIALMEFQNNPILGNGLFYYQNKIGTYPHNMILEYLCDFGIVGAILFITLMLTLIIMLIKNITNDSAMTSILIFIFSYIPKFMVSGTIYFEPMAMFAVSYAIAYILFNKYKVGGYKKCLIKK